MTTMINSIWIRTGILFLCFVSNFAFAEPIKKLTIVTTISTFADIAASVGGEYVETSSIASPRFNTHFIEPKPTDVLRLKRADLFIHGGLDLEMWRDPLVNASGRPDFRVGGERQLDVSSSVTLLDLPSGPLSRASGDIHLYGNPHYWQDPKNGL
ncbi:MAG: zinc ABC transporter substrate-binding protein, partial [Bdellovibrionales bacterium]|nr:zinc ABC transporter substrate-binding protein [Bdellovibrionales bacterium]